MSKRVLIVTTVAATVRLFAEEQLRLLLEKGYDVHVACCIDDTWLGGHSDSGMLKQVAFHNVPFSRRFSPVRDLRCLIGIYAICRSIRPDIIHYSTPKAGLLSSIASFIAGVKFRVYTIRGLLWGDRSNMGDTFLRAIESMACLLSHKITVNSKSNLEQLLRWRVCPSKKVGILGNGSSHGVDGKRRFNPDRLSFRKVHLEARRLGIDLDSDFVFGFVGRLTCDKGLVPLTKAWLNVCKRFPRAKLLVVGPWDALRGGESERQVIQRLSNMDSVVLVGPVEDTPPYYSMMKVLVLPSFREGFPNSVLEASAMRVPVITTDALGCRDSVVDRYTGFIVPAGDAKALAVKMRVMVNKPGLRRRMGRNARRRVLAEFPPDIITGDLLHLYNTSEFRRKKPSKLGDQPRSNRMCEWTTEMIGRLHASSITEGFLSSLGPSFLGELYSVLGRAPGTFILVCYKMGEDLLIESMHEAPTPFQEILGFVAGTLSPRETYQYALPRLLPKAWTIAPHLIRPTNAKRVVETVFYGLKRKAKDHSLSFASITDSAELLAMAVSPEARKRGVGRRLVKSLEQQFIQHYQPDRRGNSDRDLRYCVVCGAELLVANQFYTNLGFKLNRTFLHHGKPTNEYIRTIPCSKS